MPTIHSDWRNRLRHTPGTSFITGSLEEQVLFLARACRDAGGLFVPVFVGPRGPALEDVCRSEGLAVEALDLRRFSWRRLTGKQLAFCWRARYLSCGRDTCLVR